MTLYKCGRCGYLASFHAFRGASEDSSCLKCPRCGSTTTIFKLVPVCQEEEEIA